MIKTEVGKSRETLKYYRYVYLTESGVSNFVKMKLENKYLFLCVNCQLV